MSNADIRGRFVWHELMTSDTEAAGDFYSNVVAWRTQDSGMPSYTLWMSGDRRAAGLMALPEQEGAATPPHWIIYIGTPDVDATAAAAEKLGGKILKAAADIPGVGRFAVLSDPQGAAFAVFNPQPGSGETPPPGGELGDFTWHELATTDPEAAFRFYSELFGWTLGPAHDMGEMGIYQLLSHGGTDMAGVFKARDNSAPPNWLSYVRVADTSKAANAARTRGGRILNGPMQVPGGFWVAQLLDPQGGAFAVIEAPKPKAAAVPAKSAPARKTPAKTAPTKAEPVTVEPARTAAPAPAAKKAPAGKTAAKKAPAKKAAAKKTHPARKAAGRKKAGKRKNAAPAKRSRAAKKAKRPASRSAKRPAARSARSKAGTKARKHR
jgi:predicted enzyme related to lactoylglutathione lyase